MQSSHHKSETEIILYLKKPGTWVVESNLQTGNNA